MNRSSFGRTLRALSAALALVFASAAPAAAQIVRAFTPRVSANQAGEIVLIGNTLMSCSGNGQCPNGRNGTGGSLNDNDFTMQYVDVDADASTFSSSTANLALPTGAIVTWAGLYWGGESANALRNTCRLGTPVAGYATVTATQLDVQTSDYMGFRDVTALVQAGGNGTYRVANVYSAPGAADKHSGWSLVVMYRDATQSPRNLVVFDGFGSVSTTTNINMTVSGFLTPPGGAVSTRLGVVAFEGDLGYNGDAFQLNGTSLSDARNPADNFFNSSISSLGAQVTTKNPNYVNQLGFDIDLISANGILPNSATSATIRLTSSNDVYFPGVVTFATDLYAPVFDASNFTKTVVDVNGGSVRPGDLLEYTITMRNTGLDHATQCVIRDTLAANLAYEPGTLQIVSGPNTGAKSDASGDDVMEYISGSRVVVGRLGNGANATVGGQIDINAVTSLRFRARVQAPAPTGTVVSNQGWLSFVGAQSGVTFTASSDGDVVTSGAQPTSVTVVAARMTGTVFEDVNFGGGAGRTRASASGIVRPNVRVELYSSTGAALDADTTDAAGLYVFDGWSAGNYQVRVVNSTVTSSRPGSVATLLPVQTFRTDASGGTAVAVADRVGGEIPARGDAAANLSLATLASLTTASLTAQSVAPVTLGAVDLAGIDFGFNFDTIVNANDAGQGSLRQFVINANALTNAGLAQVGRTAGEETSLFMVSDGAAHPGLRAGLANLLTSGVVRITLLAALPALTDATTRVDGGTQTSLVGDSNAGSLGTGGPVGADDLALALLAGPEVEVQDGAGLALGFDLQAASLTLSRLAILGFGNTVGNDANADVRVGATANGARIESCALGITAQSFTDPGAALRSGGDHLRVISADNGVVTGSILAYGAGTGLTLTAGANAWSLTASELRGNTIANPALGAVVLAASGTLTASNSRITDHDGPGVDALTGLGGDSWTNVNVQRNGRGAGASRVTAGFRLGGTATRVDRCVITDQGGAGIVVASGGANHTLTRNRIRDNGTIGIDLQRASDNAALGTAPYVTLNDNGDTDTGGNALVNFPVLQSAVLANGSFTVSGWSRPGAVIELFVSDGDVSQFGEGATFVTSLTEGSVADLDAGASTYSGNVNGVAQGTDLTNHFRFTIAAPPGVAAGIRLTATATQTGIGTSEFSGIVTVTTGVSLSGIAYNDLDHDAQRDPGETGTLQTLYAKLVRNGSALVSQTVSVNPTTGAYAFTFVNAGAYDIILDQDASPADLLPTVPPGWLGTEVSSGVRVGVAVNATDVGAQDFGLYHGSRVQGRVFRDDGAAGGVANDGAAQSGEASVMSTRVRLASATCASGNCDSTLTDGAGAFTLWIPFTLAGQSVRVQEQDPSSWRSTGGAPGGTGGTYDRASDAVSFIAMSGTRYTGLAFGDVPQNTWVANGARTIAAGSVAWYSHRFTAGSGGSVSFGAVQSLAPSVPGWSMELYRDLDCDGVFDAGEPLLAAPLSVSAGTQVCVLARHSSPAAAPNGATSIATLTASFAYTGASPSLSGDERLDDLTTIAASGGLLLAKTVDRDSVRAGQLITYTITYTNPGSAALSNIVIRDATPAWTVFDAASCATVGTGITGCTLTASPTLGTAGPVEWTLSGSLAPGAFGSVSFRVRVP